HLRDARSRHSVARAPRRLRMKHVPKDDTSHLDSHLDLGPDQDADGIDRRGFLTCMAWAGTGALWVMKGGVLESHSLSNLARLADKDVKADLSFVQISDSHMGFNKAANTDVVGTFKAAIEKINALPTKPALMLHTGDIS